MNGDMFPFGFIVRGGPEQPRRVCVWRRAFVACAECAQNAPCGAEAYLSMFCYGADFVEHMKEHRTPKGFEGDTGGPFVWMDFDGRGALDDVRRLVAYLETQGVDPAHVLVFFSGGKGFHAGIPSALTDARPGPLFHAAARVYAEGLVRDAGAAGTLDTGIYDRVRIFRAPNSRHAKSGLHKVLIPSDSILRIGEPAILDLAREPRPFEVPDTPALDFGLARRWADALAQAEAAHARRTGLRTAAAHGEARLNPSTLQFLRDGADNGERATRLFQAAANLSECGAPARLVAQLLEEPALDSGLPPAEVRRQITTGIEHGGRGHG